MLGEPADEAGRQQDPAEREEAHVGEARDQEEGHGPARDVPARQTTAALEDPGTKHEPAGAMTEKSELAASSDNPISVLVRQLMRRQNTTRNATTYDAHDPSCSCDAERKPLGPRTSEVVAQRAEPR